MIVKHPHYKSNYLFRKGSEKNMEDLTQEDKEKVLHISVSILKFLQIGFIAACFLFILYKVAFAQEIDSINLGIEFDIYQGDAPYGVLIDGETGLEYFYNSDKIIYANTSDVKLLQEALTLATANKEQKEHAESIR